ncbi:right-handed parallel beta-helix repeat-containing protein [bacterium]|nr:right-handed parallel beta-helix repeat-containing protein [bacterium]
MKFNKKIYKVCLLIFLLVASFSFPANNKNIPNKFFLPTDINENIYGCGKNLAPGKTYYLSPNGNDNSDGLSLKTSWKNPEYAFTQLQPGDTLLISEGSYNTSGVVIGCSGEEGKPITIKAISGHRVIFNSSEYTGSLVKTPDRRFTYEVVHRLPRPPYLSIVEVSGIWEEPSVIKLENAGSLERVDELPGTFHYDESNDKIYVRFSNSRGPDANRIAVVARPIVIGVSHGRRDIYKEGRGGVELKGSYVCIKNINFRYGFAGLAVYDGQHNTIENCSFFATELAGLVLWRNTKWTLVKNNYGIRNGTRGGILIDKTSGTRNADSDNLFIGNRIDSSVSTLRTAGVPVYGAIRTYGWPGPRNHIINNIMNEPTGSTFLGRGIPVGSLFEGNVIVGSYSALNWYGEFAKDGSERIVVRNNTVTGTMNTQGLSVSSDSTGDNIFKHDITFLNNLVLGNNQTKITDAGFADTTYSDYRLHSDSPFLCKGVGGGNVGAYLKQAENIYFVMPEGKDTALGTSPNNAFKTISTALSKLKPGDTLYVSEGSYPENLVVKVSGTAEKPILIRAYKKQQVKTKKMVINGSYVTVEGFTFTDIKDGGIIVRGKNVSIKNCLFEKITGAGIRAFSAENLGVYQSTFVNNSPAIVLEKRSIGAKVRDNIFAGTYKKPVSITPDSQKNFIASHNAYQGSKIEYVSSDEWGSLVGDIKFVDPQKNDYRVYSDSPVAFMNLFTESAGAFPSAVKPFVVENVRTTALRDKSVTVVWNTPFDDTTGKVFYRQKGTSVWSLASNSEYGTIHAVGITGLKPKTEYEFKIENDGRRGGNSSSSIFSFITSDKQITPSTFYVAPNGNDDNNGLSQKNAWRTIRKANIEAGPGDTILVLPGEYFHPISPISSGYAGMRITYRKHGQGDVIINGIKAILPIVSIQSKHYITVDGFTFTNPPDLAEGVLGINNSSNIEILNCCFGYKTPLGGAFLKGGFVKNAPNLRVEGNLFWGARYHLEVWGNSPGLLIKNNTFVRGDVCSVRIHGDIDAKFLNNIFYHPTTQVNNGAILLGVIKKENFLSDHNLFCFKEVEKTKQIGKMVDFNGKKASTLSELREITGGDTNSLHADPLFVDIDKGDFSLKPGSPAIGSGINGENMGTTKTCF